MSDQAVVTLPALLRWSGWAAAGLAAVLTVAWNASREVTAKSSDLSALDRRVTTIEATLAKQPDATGVAAQLDRVLHRLDRTEKSVARLVCKLDPPHCDDAMSAIGDGAQ